MKVLAATKLAMRATALGNHAGSQGAGWRQQGRIQVERSGRV